jgi:hypothetical protein
VFVVHDYFDIVGVSGAAPPREIRLACARRVRHAHPDFTRTAAAASCSPETDAWMRPPLERDPRCPDVAIDFLDMGSVVSRIHAAFFEDPR